MVDMTANPHAGLVPVDSGLVLCVDPCNLPVDVLRAITQPNAYGVTTAVVYATPTGDGLWPVADPDWHTLDAVEVNALAGMWPAGA